MADSPTRLVDKRGGETSRAQQHGWSPPSTQPSAPAVRSWSNYQSWLRSARHGPGTILPRSTPRSEHKHSCASDLIQRDASMLAAHTRLRSRDAASPPCSTTFVGCPPPKEPAHVSGANRQDERELQICHQLTCSRTQVAPTDNGEASHAASVKKLPVCRDASRKHASPRLSLHTNQTQNCPLDASARALFSGIEVCPPSLLQASARLFTKNIRWRVDLHQHAITW